MQRRAPFFLYVLYPKLSYIFAIRLPIPVAHHPSFGTIRIRTPIFRYSSAPYKPCGSRMADLDIWGWNPLGRMVKS